MTPDSLTVEVFGPVGNRAVIRFPGRAFPAIAIQGDSFSELVAMAQQLAKRAATNQPDELREAADELRDSLEAVLSEYERALEGHGMRLPYARAP